MREGWVHHGLARRSTLSCNGRVEICRRRYQQSGSSKESGRSDAPIDELIDLCGNGVSLAVREMCCRIATDSGSFTRAAANLNRLAQLKLSDEKLRQLAESEGRAVLRWQEHEQLELDFEPRCCLTDQTGDGSIRSRVYVGIDGFMLPMVTDAEQARRFEKAKQRRRERRRKQGVCGARGARLKRRTGADQRYKEIKLVTMYDQAKAHRLLRATRHGVKQTAALLRQMSEDVKLKQAEQIVAITDGAEWIARLIETHLPRETTAILDYFHASQHVHQTRREVFGEESEPGRAWAERVLDSLSNQSFDHTQQMFVQTRRRIRSPAKRRALEDLVRYLTERREKVDYNQFRKDGLDVGSGPTESMCKSLSRRMKGIGMRWTVGNAESMVALEALHQSSLWTTYWSTRLAA